MTSSTTYRERSSEMDPGSLTALKHAELLLHSYRQAEHHIEIEATEDIDRILETLTLDGPYAYTKLPVVEDGRLRSRVASDRDEIRACYEGIHAHLGLRGWRSASQVLSTWYSFHAGWATTESKIDGTMVEYEALVIFPTMGKTGITGELFWNRTSPGVTPLDGESPSDVRRRVLQDQEAYLEATRTGDSDGMLAAFAPEVQINFRGYTGGIPGKLTELDGHGEFSDYIAQFHARYTPERIDVLHQQVEDWYVFSEKQWTVKSTTDDTRLRYLTAEYSELGPDGKIIARIGHGTEPVRV